MKTAASLRSGLPRWRRGRGSGHKRGWRRPAWLQALLRKRVDVLPLYQPQRAGWVIAARRLTLLVFLVFAAAFYGIAAAILPPSLLGMMAAPLGLVALAVIWALPEARRAPTEALTRLFSIFLGALLLWPNYIAVSVAGLPWISVRRVVAAAIFLLLLICLSISRQYRAETKEILKASRPASTLFLAFLVAQVLASILSVSPFSDLPRLLASTYTVTPMFFVALWVLGTGKRSIDWWMNWLLVYVSVLMVIGVFEYRAQHVLWAYSIPSWLHVDDDILKQVLTPNFRDTYRVVTTFTVSLVWGELVALMMPLALHRIVNAKGVGGLAAWILFDLALWVSAVLSGARLAVVGGITAHVVYLLLWALRRWRTDRGGLIGLSATMIYPAFMVVFIGAIAFVPAVHNRVLGGGATQLSNQGRQEQWALGIPAIAKRPLLGYGPGEGAGAVGWRTQGGFLSIDSGYLSTAADYGVIGFFTFFGGVVALVLMLSYQGIFSRVSGYPPELAFAAVYVTFLTSRSVLSQGDNESLYWMLFGIGVALVYLGKRAKAAEAADAAA